jgi:acetolactate synthase-1/2/3 large subunit
VSPRAIVGAATLSPDHDPEVRAVPTCGEAVVRLLEQHGVDTVFGIPGVHTLEIYRGLGASPIRHVTPRHEQGAAHMADGYARVTGRPGVCILITGAGLTNAATAVASAYHDSIPVLVVSSSTHTRDLRHDTGALHDMPDQQALMATITAASIEVTDPADLPAAFARAFAIFESARPRPVHIGIPIDVLDMPTAEPVRLPAGAARPVATPDALAAAVDLLAGAASPMVLLGGGAVHAGAEASALAARIGAPVGMTVNAKGAVPDGDPLSVGTSLTLAPVYDALESADVVLAVGTEFSETDYFYAPGGQPPTFRGSLVRIDIDPVQAGRRRPAAVELVGDAAETVAALEAALADRGIDRRAVGAARAAALRDGVTWWAGSEAFTPFLDVLAAAIPTGGVLFADSTQPAYVAHHRWPGRASREYIAPAGFGTLGPALPMAIGAQVAQPGRPVAVLAGDGGFLFTIQELATAADEGLPLAIVLWQNHGYGEIKDSMDRVDVPHVGVATSARDFLRLAEGFGCNGVRCGSLAELGDLVRAAFAGDRPTLIEVPATVR